MIGQKAYSLKHKLAGISPADARPAKDPSRPVIKATRAVPKKPRTGGSKKKPAVAAPPVVPTAPAAAPAAITTGANDTQK